MPTLTFTPAGNEVGRMRNDDIRIETSIFFIVCSSLAVASAIKAGVLRKRFRVPGFPRRKTSGCFQLSKNQTQFFHPVQPWLREVISPALTMA